PFIIVLSPMEARTGGLFGLDAVMVMVTGALDRRRLSFTTNRMTYCPSRSGVKEGVTDVGVAIVEVDPIGFDTSDHVYVNGRLPSGSVLIDPSRVTTTPVSTLLFVPGFAIGCSS